MTSPRLGVAVVGTAFMGRAHSNAWRNVGAFHPAVPLVRQQVLVGRDPARTAEAADRLGWAEWSADWREVIHRDDVDLVDVCLPGHLHAEVAIAALDAGKHVLVEKPLANSLEEAERMVVAADAARRLGVRSMVGFNYRRVPALALARSIIAEGRIGTLREVRAAYLQDWLADDSAPMTWRLRQETAGSGALGDLGSHVVDQLRYLTGREVASVSGHLRTFVPERGGEPVTVDDAAWVTLELDGGAVASLEVSRVATARKNGLRIEVYGSTGAIEFSLESLNELWVSTDGGSLCRTLVTEPEHPYLDAWWPPGHVLGWDHSFTNQAADLLAAIGAGTDPEPSFADGLAVQRVLTAVQESSAQQGRRIDLVVDGDQF